MSPGSASRSFIAAIKVCPPASSFACGLAARMAVASSTDVAFWYLNEYMGFPSVRRASGRFEFQAAAACAAACTDLTML